MNYWKPIYRYRWGTPHIARNDSSSDSICQKFEIKALLNDEAVFGKGVGVGLRKSDEDLRAKFNAAIAQVLSDGTYDGIAKKYFDFDIYGK